MSSIFNISNVKNSLTKDSFIESGYGEYIIYRAESSKAQGFAVDRETFEKCYQVFLKAKQIFIESEKRKFLKQQINKIDPTIKLIFIPRTLYELCFIEKCIKETIRRGQICNNSNRSKMNQPERKCWHGTSFTDFGDDQNSIIINLAYRLNKSIFKEINLNKDQAIRYEQIVSLANEKISFLKSCHTNSNSKTSSKLQEITDCSRIEITNNMISESEKGSCSKPIGIATEKMKELVLNVIALECSEIAKGKLILYRGSKINNDIPLEYDEKGNVTFVQGLSFGTGLFSGGMNDPGAAAFYYMRKSTNDAIALLVPQEEESVSPFAIPKTHPLCQMFGYGEKWHARSRAPTVNVDSEIKLGCKHGMSVGRLGNIPKHFLLAVTPKEFEEKFQAYKKCIVNLKD